MSVHLGTAAAVFGIAGTTSVTIGAAVHSLINSYDYSVEDDEVSQSGNDGDIEILVSYNKRERATIEVTPSSTSQALALANLTVPDPKTIITVAATSGDPQLAGAGNWIVVRASKRAGNNSLATITLEIIRYTNTLVVKT